MFTWILLPLLDLNSDQEVSFERSGPLSFRCNRQIDGREAFELIEFVFLSLLLSIMAHLRGVCDGCELNRLVGAGGFRTTVL